jgi:hypothetical protein
VKEVAKWRLEEAHLTLERAMTRFNENRVVEALDDLTSLGCYSKPNLSASEQAVTEPVQTNVIPMHRTRRCKTYFVRQSRSGVDLSLCASSGRR